MTTCRKNFTFSWPLRGRGVNPSGQPDRFFPVFFLKASLSQLTKEIGLSCNQGIVKLYEKQFEALTLWPLAMITSGERVLEKVSQSVLVIHHQTLILSVITLRCCSWFPVNILLTGKTIVISSRMPECQNKQHSTFQYYLLFLLPDCCRNSFLATSCSFSGQVPNF